MNGGSPSTIFEENPVEANPTYVSAFKIGCESDLGVKWKQKDHNFHG